MRNPKIIWEPYSKKIWKESRLYWLFLCDLCWNEKEINMSKYRSWDYKSCWCMKINYWHWKTNDPLYKIYHWILDRCNNKNIKSYKRYWWRWIKCEWKNFIDFYVDMLHWYKKWLQIDRINNDWNYSKINCRWVKPKENCRNTSKTIIYKWMSLRDYCDNNNISRNIVKHAIYHKWLDIDYVINNISTVNAPSYIYKHYKWNKVKYQVKIKWKSHWYFKTEREAEEVRDFLLSIQ